MLKVRTRNNNPGLSTCNIYLFSVILRPAEEYFTQEYVTVASEGLQMQAPLCLAPAGLKQGGLLIVHHLHTTRALNLCIFRNHPKTTPIQLARGKEDISCRGKIVKLFKQINCFLTQCKFMKSKPRVQNTHFIQFLQVQEIPGFSMIIRGYPHLKSGNCYSTAKCWQYLCARISQIPVHS